MIIKNVIVYTEDKKFTAGGIVVHDDKIESISTGVWEMTSVITVKRLLKILQNMRLLWVLQQSHQQR